MPRQYSEVGVQYNDPILYNEERDLALPVAEARLGINGLGNFSLGFAAIDEIPFIEIGAVIQRTQFDAITVGASVVRDLSDAYVPITEEEFLDEQPSSVAYVGFGKENTPAVGKAPTFFLPLVSFDSSENYDTNTTRHLGVGVDAEHVIKSSRNVSSSFAFVPSSMGMATLFSSLLWADPTTDPQGFYYLHEIQPGNKYNSITVESGFDNQYVVRRYGMMVTSINLSCNYGEAAQASVDMVGTLSELRDYRWTPDYYRTPELSFNNAQILQDDVALADIISCEVGISNSMSPYRLLTKRYENDGFIIDGREITVQADIDVRDQAFYTLMREGTDFKLAFELSDDFGENFIRIVLTNVEITSLGGNLPTGPQQITAIARQQEVSPILVQIGNHFSVPV